MPANAYRRGGADVPVTDGGTGASDAGTARTNLGALDTTAHEGIDHTAGPFNLLDETAHDALDHSGLTGIPTDPLIDNQGPGTGPGTSSVLSLTIPANTLTADGQILEAHAIALTDDSGAGASFDTNVFGSTEPGGSVSPGEMSITVRIRRTGATTGEAIITRISVVSGAVVSTYNGGISQDWTSAGSITFTAAGDNAGNIVHFAYAKRVA